jgi:S1-C subfamily serine protease
MSAAPAGSNGLNWRAGWTPAWVAAFALTGLAILVLLAVLAWREWRTSPDAVASPALQERLDRNLTLEREIATLTAQPLGSCGPDPADPVTTVRPDISETQPTLAAPSEKALSNRELVAMLNEATAMVLSDGGSATGFFIAPDLLVTNRHAVEGSSRDIYVTSKSLGRVHRGVVLAISDDRGNGAADFALVRVEGAPARRKLAFSTEIEPLMPVVASGYPGLTIVHDAGFRALLGGDITAAPELVLNRGEIQALQRSPQGLRVIAHSGRLLHGNSGGPLVDGCGRVVGINTYIAVDAEHAGHVSYAIAAEELVPFLAAHGADGALAKASCGG